MATQLDDPRIIEFDVRTDEMLVNMGPQHPSTHGVLRLVLRTDGEVVREVLPHVPDAWIDESKTKIGYEIPLTRHFYEYKPLRPLKEIEAEIKQIEGEIVALLAGVMGE